MLNGFMVEVSHELRKQFVVTRYDDGSQAKKTESILNNRVSLKRQTTGCRFQTSIEVHVLLVLRTVDLFANEPHFPN